MAAGKKQSGTKATKAAAPKPARSKGTANPKPTDAEAEQAAEAALAAAEALVASHATAAPATAGDVRAAKKIAAKLIELEALDADLKDTRKKWAGTIGAAEATFRGAVQAPDDGTPTGARAKLDQVCTAFQDMEEAEAGRRDELTLKLEARKKVKAELRTYVEGARQLGLFDDQ